MRNLLIALVLLTLSLPSLAWTSSTLKEGAKGIKVFESVTGKEVEYFGFSTKLNARSVHPNKNFPTIDYGPSVEFLPFIGKCNPFEHQPDKSVKIQGTMVRMTVSCPTSGNGLSMKPLSEAGTKYVFNTFKARNQVIFEADSSMFCGNSSTGSCMFKIDTSDFNVTEKEAAFSGGI